MREQNPPSLDETDCTDAGTRTVYTRRDLARLLGCSRRHVYHLVERGRIPAPVRFGTLVRWSRPAIEAWIAAGCPAPNEEPRP